MIINIHSKMIVERLDKPNENWTGDNENYFLVDSNSELANKIRENAPFMNFVVNDDKLIDIIPTERPPEPEPEPTIEEMLLEMDYRLTCVELGL